MPFCEKNIQDRLKYLVKKRVLAFKQAKFKLSLDSEKINSFSDIY